MAVKQVEIIVPSSPADREAIAAGIKEMSNAMVRIQGEKDYIKESVEALSEKYDLDKKYIKQMLNDFYKDTFDKKVDEIDQYSELYQAVFPK